MLEIPKKTQVSTMGLENRYTEKSILNPFPTKDVYIHPMFCHATTEDVYIRPRIKNITKSPVVRDVLNKLSPVVKKGLALFYKDC